MNIETSNIKNIDTPEEMEALWNSSAEKPVLILKHSTTCSISAAAYSAFKGFVSEGHQELETALVLVRENRPASNRLAELSGVRHESPQAFLIKDRQVIWHASHWNITGPSLSQAVQAL